MGFEVSIDMAEKIRTYTYELLLYLSFSEVRPFVERRNGEP